MSSDDKSVNNPKFVTLTGSGDRAGLAQTKAGNPDRPNQNKHGRPDAKYSTTGVEVPAVTPYQAIIEQAQEAIAAGEGQYGPPEQDDPDDER